MSTEIDKNLLAAISLLDPKVEAHWTKPTKKRPILPNAQALTEILGRRVSVKERDAAWAHHLENQKKQQADVVEPEEPEQAVAEETQPVEEPAAQPAEETAEEQTSEPETEDGETEPEDEESETPEPGDPQFVFTGTYTDGETQTLGYQFREGEPTTIDPSDAHALGKLRGNPLFKEV